MTQARAAADLGLAWRTWQDYERGERKPPLEGLLKLADYFGVSLDYLTGRTDKKEINR